MSQNLVVLSPREIKEAKRAGYMVGGAPGQKLGFFGSMFSNFGTLFTARGAWFGGANSAPPVNLVQSESGQAISPETALTLSAVWSCVWLNARTLAALPLNLKRYEADGANELAEDVTLFKVLRWKSNYTSTAYNFWCALWANEQLWGTGYARKIKSAGQVVGLDLLLSQYMTPYMTAGGELRFSYTHPREPLDLPASDVFRVFTRSLDGIVGQSVISFARNSLGLARSGEYAASKTFAKGLNASGFVQADKFLTPPQREMIRTSVDEFTGQGPRSGGTMVLEGGFKYEQISMKPLDAELLASRQFSVEDVCRWFNVPPILIGHASAGQTMWGSGIEQILRGYVNLGLRNYTIAATQAIQSDLIRPGDAGELYAEYDFDELLAADSTARAQLYASLSQNGINTRNELRAREGLSPMPGGDVLTVQSNLLPLDQLGAALAAAGGSTSAQKFRDALIELIGTAEQPGTKEKP
jgi:HK97 family phage portal protein